MRALRTRLPLVWQIAKLHKKRSEDKTENNNFDYNWWNFKFIDWIVWFYCLVNSPSNLFWPILEPVAAFVLITHRFWIITWKSWNGQRNELCSAMVYMHWLEPRNGIAGETKIRTVISKCLKYYHYHLNGFFVNCACACACVSAFVVTVLNRFNLCVPFR